MFENKVYQKKKAHFKGALTLNTRSIIDSLSLIHKYENRYQKDYKELISLEELSNLLHFLEAIIMGNKIYYDGTVPKKITDQIIDLIEYTDTELRINHTKPNTISPININSSKLLIKRCKEAMEQSSEMILNTNFKKVVDQKLENPIKKTDDVENFFHYIDKNYQNKKERKDFALEIACSKNFQGSKCILGLLTSEKTSKDVLTSVQTWANKLTNSISRKYFMAALINRFRVNYINALSSTVKSSYLADTRIESIQNYQVLLLWKYICKRIAYKKNHNKIPKELKSQIHKLPIGYAFILNSKSSNPIDLLSEAIEKRDSLSIKYDSKQASNRYIHELSEDELWALQENLFKEHYNKLVIKKSPFKSRFNDALQFTLPVILGEASKFAVNLVAAYLKIETSEFMTGIIGGTTQSVSQKFDIKKGAKAYVTNIHNWKNEYIDAIDSNDLTTDLINRIENIFNKKLKI